MIVFSQMGAFMIIREVDLFEGFYGEVEEELADAFETISYRKGEMLFRQGDPAESFYILRKKMNRAELRDCNLPSTKRTI